MDCHQNARLTPRGRAALVEAGRFAEIARDEARHRAAFEAALRQLGDAAGGRAHRYK